MNKTYRLILFFLSLMYFLPFLGGAHLFDWDEINFAECAREMVETGDYMRITIGYRPFWEKPPLFIWFQAATMNLFGVNEFAARLPNALCGIVTLQVLFAIGARLFSQSVGFYWALFYLGSVAPFVYFKSGIIDPWFNLFIFLAVYFLFRGLLAPPHPTRLSLTTGTQSSSSMRNAKMFFLLLAGIFAGLAVLTKGPVALLIITLTFGFYGLIFLKRNRWLETIAGYAFFSLIALATAALWFGAEYWQHGDWFIRSFIDYQLRLLKTEDAGHGGFLGYHVVVLLLGCFPASVFALPQIFKPLGEGNQKQFLRILKTLFWVVLVLFSLVQSKIIHYSSLCYIPLTFMAAVYAEQLFNRKVVLPKSIFRLLAVIGGTWALAMTALPLIGLNSDLIKPLLQNDPFAAANLNAEVEWSGFETFFGLSFAVLFVYVLRLFWVKNYSRALPLLLFGMATAVFCISAQFAPKIERYTQGAAVDYFASLAGKNCYIETYGYKSYAHFFYARFPKPSRPEYYGENPGWWLQTGDVDRDVYLCAKISRKGAPETPQGFTKTGEKNGFVFFYKPKR